MGETSPSPSPSRAQGHPRERGRDPTHTRAYPRWAPVSRPNGPCPRNTLIPSEVPADRDEAEEPDTRLAPVRLHSATRGLERSDPSAPALPAARVLVGLSRAPVACGRDDECRAPITSAAPGPSTPCTRSSPQTRMPASARPPCPGWAAPSRAGPPFPASAPVRCW